MLSQDRHGFAFTKTKVREGRFSQHLKARHTSHRSIFSELPLPFFWVLIKPSNIESTVLAKTVEILIRYQNNEKTSLAGGNGVVVWGVRSTLRRDMGFTGNMGMPFAEANRVPKKLAFPPLSRR